ncbi:SET domain-containing protein [Haoranjiania flava]|uniref:SET domain-containing protein n=1 Tax=Haoranjiania flava TaxID=1856322 RepID=A0AAE3IQV0_9BACT|nr:SET domain-containing protein [Haoranjiania flava]MCU7695408.1 SET domain-containing protein [Haoranjiania flava]
MPYLVVAESGNKGRGVFTTENIKSGTVVEVSPVLELTKKERKTVEKTKLYHYIFEWGKNLKKAALALGYVSMYNHSYDANCEYEMDYDANTMTIRTIRPVKKGQELFINYNAVPDDKTPVWFDELIEKECG